MRFDVVTLFPELFAPHLAVGVTRRAFETGQVEVKLWPLRDFADDNYRRVDDRPYGGGPGMVMLVEPLLRALDAITADRGGPAALLLAALGGGRRRRTRQEARHVEDRDALADRHRGQGLDAELVFHDAQRDLGGQTRLLGDLDRHVAQRHRIDLGGQLQRRAIAMEHFKGLLERLLADHDHVLARPRPATTT